MTIEVCVNQLHDDDGTTRLNINNGVVDVVLSVNSTMALATLLIDDVDSETSIKLLCDFGLLTSKSQTEDWLRAAFGHANKPFCSNDATIVILPEMVRDVKKMVVIDGSRAALWAVAMMLLMIAFAMQLPVINLLLVTCGAVLLYFKDELMTK